MKVSDTLKHVAVMISSLAMLSTAHAPLSLDSILTVTPFNYNPVIIHDLFKNQRLEITGILDSVSEGISGFGCTLMACSETNPCCNSCSLFDSVGFIESILGLRITDSLETFTEMCSWDDCQDPGCNGILFGDTVSLEAEIKVNADHTEYYFVFYRVIDKEVFTRPGKKGNSALSDPGFCGEVLYRIDGRARKKQQHRNLTLF